MSSTTRAAGVIAALAIALGLIGSAASASPEPVGPTGTGPSTTVVGHYWLITPEGHTTAPAFAPASEDRTFPLPAYWRVQVWGEGSSCVVPDTRELHTGADDHQADCLSVPEVTEAWAR